ncbi:MAG TPA: ABC transporter permease [Gemmatimonadaceae bacterium]|nr:ABC transporter permease [Gemmatimonadaceae bacterium]
MPLLPRLRHLARNLLFRARAEHDLDDELRAYVELLTEEKRRAGLPPAAARRAALLEVGGMEQVKEEVRDARAGAWLHGVAQDLRYGARALARERGFTIAVVLTLALGIGATTAILGVVDAVLLRPLPYADAGRLVALLHEGHSPVAPANYLDWRERTRTFAAMGAAEAWGPALAGDGPPEQVTAMHLTGTMFPMLGVRPMLGRTFGPGEDEPGRDHVVVLGHGLWQRRFGGRASVVGETIRLDGEPYTVIGVMPPTFGFAPFWITDAELWAPLSLAPRAADRGAQSLRVFARLADGATLAQARGDVAGVTAALERELPGTNRDVRVRPLLELAVGDVRPALLVLLAAVSLVLLIACANVAHLLLARGVARRRELAVRSVLGATRRRTVRQLLTESLLLAAVGGAGGVLLAAGAVRALAVLGPAFVPRIGTARVDARVLAAAAAVTLLTGLVFGVLPALRAARPDLADAFREGGRGASGGVQRRRLRAALVVSEFALAIVLLVGAGLLARSFVALRAVDPGFDARGVVLATVSTAGSAHAEPAQRAAFFEELARRAATLPGVAAASVVNHVPLAGDVWGTRYHPEGEAAVPHEDWPRATWRVAMPDYFRTMGIALRRGRGFGPQDRADAPAVAVVNEALAAAAWPGEDPVGRRLTLDDSSWITVVGVVADVAQDAWGAAPQPELYRPYAQDATYREEPGNVFGTLTLVLRADCAPGAACDATALAPAVRRLVSAMDAGVAVSRLQAMERVVADATGRPRFYLLLLGAFAAIALALAAVGIYGITSYGVSHRRREIGIRIALGAAPWRVVGLLVAQAMALALVGAAVGAAGALLLTRLMAGLLYGVGATDPATFVGVALLLGGVALVATVIPAARAARTDPLEALRAE